MEFWQIILIIIAIFLCYVLAKLMYIKLDISIGGSKTLKLTIIILSFIVFFFLCYLFATNFFIGLLILGIMIALSTLISLLKF